MAKGYRAVAISPRTGKPLEKPRKGQKVIPGIIGPRGKVTKLSVVPQDYLQRDFDGLTRQVQDTVGGNYIIQEQLTRKAIRDRQGRIMRHTTGPKKGKSVYQTKITYPQPARRQKPVLFTRGTKRREIGIGYIKGNYRSVAKAGRLTLAKVTPEAPPVKITITGPTIKSALEKLQIDTSFKEIQKAGKDHILYYSVLLKIEKPDGSVSYIPTTGANIPQPFTSVNNQIIDGKSRAMGRQGLEKPSNLYSQLGTSIRTALLSQNFRYTRPQVLEKFEAEENRVIDKMKQQGVDEDVIEEYENVKDRLTHPNYYATRAQIMGTDKNKKLTQVTGDYKITAFIKFDIGVAVGGKKRK